MAQFIIISYENKQAVHGRNDLMDIVFFSQEVDEYIYISKCFLGGKTSQRGHFGCNK